MAKGERLLKDVYEGLRNGPAWDKTLMMVMYDDWGGTYDHVVPPHEGVPDDEAPCNVPKAPNSDVSCSGFDVPAPIRRYEDCAMHAFSSPPSPLACI